MCPAAWNLAASPRALARRAYPLPMTRRMVAVLFLLLATFAGAAIAQQGRRGAAPQQTPAASPAPPPTLEALLKSLPDAPRVALDEASAHLLVAAPLACLDELQARPSSRA